MPSKNKARGNRFERQLVKLFLEKDIEAKRAYASNGQSLGYKSEVDLVAKVFNKDFKIQAKKRKKIASFMKPNENVDAQIINQDRDEPLIILKLKTFFEVLKWSTDIEQG